MNASLQCYIFGRHGEDGYEHQMFFEAKDLDTISRFAYRHDGPLTEWSEHVTFLLTGTGVEDIPFGVGGWLLFSDKLKCIVEEARLTGMTFYPVRILTEGIGPVLPYWYAHIAHVHGAIDMGKSLYTYPKVKGVKPDPLNMVKPVLLGEKIVDVDVFRVAETLPPVFCSERFPEAFSKGRCSGIGFHKTPVT